MHSFDNLLFIVWNVDVVVADLEVPVVIENIDVVVVVQSLISCVVVVVFIAVFVGGGDVKEEVKVVIVFLEDVPGLKLYITFKTNIQL